MPDAEGGEPNPLDDPSDEFETASDIDARTVRITFFPDEAAQFLHTEELTLSQLADRIAKQTAASKRELPWLKLAIFGNQRSEKNCLRTQRQPGAVSLALKPSTTQERYRSTPQSQ